MEKQEEGKLGSETAQFALFLLLHTAGVDQELPRCLGGLAFYLRGRLFYKRLAATLSFTTSFQIELHKGSKHN